MVLEGEVKIENVQQWKALKAQLYEKQWVVYAKSPMGSVSQVVEYLSRYAHKVAISNHRIVEVGDQTVKFQYKDYSDHNKVKQMPLTTGEFIRYPGQFGPQKTGQRYFAKNATAASSANGKNTLPAADA